LPSLVNLVVDLAQPLPVETPAGFVIAGPDAADPQMLAWIDEVFGGAWSGEAIAGRNLVATREATVGGFATIDAKGLKYAWLAGLARERDVGLLGPFGVAPVERKTGLAAALLRSALNALRASGYARALIPAVGDERLVRFYCAAAGARVAETFEPAALYRSGRRTLVLASGNGSNFQAVIDATAGGHLPLDVVALFANNAHAHALARARDAGVPSHLLVWNRSDETREAYDLRLLEAAQAEQPDLILLLGWMHLLSARFVAAFAEMLNVHPAFLPLDPASDVVVFPDGSVLPAFRGARAVRDALAAGSPWVGATLHRVTGQTDRGAVMARKPLRVAPAEDEANLMRRVHEIERRVVRDGIVRWLYER
jgi:phosphoribosylglycinamide formyltransferase 1